MLFLFCLALWFYCGAFHVVLSCSLTSFFSVLSSLVTILLREERAGLYAFRAIVCSSYMSCFLSFSLPLFLFSSRYGAVHMVWI